AEMEDWSLLQTTNLESLQTDPLLSDPSDSVLLALLRYVAAARRVSSLCIWAGADEGGAIEDLVSDESNQVIVLDVQSLREREEKEIVVQETLEAAWGHCQQRALQSLLVAGVPPIPHFLVIDEAHNWVPVEARDRRTAGIRNLIRSVAAEGRKSGLFLILCTQRPRKIHPDVLSECDNIFVMRLPNPADLALVGNQFGQPMSRLRCARWFDPGEAIYISGRRCDARRFHLSPRRTTEGGPGIIERK
ncbi:ATP-binding protein, partial [Candidatus Bipolaricaulota bacterium]